MPPGHTKRRRTAAATTGTAVPVRLVRQPGEQLVAPPGHPAAHGRVVEHQAAPRGLVDEVTSHATNLQSEGPSKLQLRYVR
jgi:hypothetical protein